ncbi:MAG TPA: hypothetical protein VG406_10395 [Isosphaeraceae bacterium]|jgi:hypothetical protein|nr:hypothetical protein [Isosphaeraceae bacterium]
MRRPRFSIASLLGVVVFVAVGLAALRAASPAWDAGLLGVTLGALLVAVLLAVHRADRRRAFWLGFALFGWAYLLVILAPGVEPRLPTTKFLTFLDSKRPKPTGGGIADLDNDGNLDLLVVDAAGQLKPLQRGGSFADVSVGSAPGGGNGPTAFATWALPARSRRTTEDFVRIGHSLFALMLAVVGGLVSRMLHDSKRGQESA